MIADDGPIAAEKYCMYKEHNVELNNSVVVEGLHNVWICIKFHKKFKK